MVNVVLLVLGTSVGANIAVCMHPQVSVRTSNQHTQSKPEAVIYFMYRHHLRVLWTTKETLKYPQVSNGLPFPCNIM